ncbi:DUF1127 domain-containing protein [Hwanghaeella grinnelliae]|uniref:DUF1127 domain-containing protein n=1 Tax=Hwanghaeella grinnelliae TaxID=2500179 RepID=A0A437QVP5_9PROT|nr:DUF1127 domain-containing protein [Hwanghaeella grinnelliae]RVU38600.1 DUF1127 domain-containing protein [Hwanghaeella grinnelliae]
MSEQNICLDSFTAARPQKARWATLTSFDFGHLLAEFRAWRENQETLRHLRSLNDHQLRDIGLRKHDLPPALQDQMVADRHGMEALFPHALVTLKARNKPKVCD